MVVPDTTPPLLSPPSEETSLPRIPAPRAATALAKDIVVLKALHQLGNRARLADISRQTGLAKSTVHRTLSRLMAHNLVGRSESHYSPVHSLSAAGHSPFHAAQVLLPLLNSLHREAHATTSLAVLTADHDHVRYLLTLPVPGVPVPARPPGWQTAAADTAAGLLLLAHHPRNDLPLTASHSAQRCHSAIRRRGTAVRSVPTPTGPTGIAALAAGTREGSVALEILRPGISTAAELHRYTDVLQRHAQAATRLIGRHHLLTVLLAETAGSRADR